jgi:hypothetical protein
MRTKLGIKRSNFHVSRLILDKLGKKLGFTNIENWYNLASIHLKKNDSNHLLELYGPFISDLIRTTFPEHKWVDWKFKELPPNCWEKTS